MPDQPVMFAADLREARLMLESRGHTLAVFELSCLVCEKTAKHEGWRGKVRLTGELAEGRCPLPRAKAVPADEVRR